VFITGTTGGIGAASAQLFLEHGWQVIATAREPERLGDWCRSNHVTVISLDVTDEYTAHYAINEAIQRHGSIDVLVNNAGAGLAGPVEAIPQAEFEALFAANFFGAVRLTRLLLPHFRKAGAGTIVNVSSIAGRMGLPLRSPYCATKFALEGFTESLYYELKPHGLRVKLVEPGGIRTQFKTEWHSHPVYERVVEKLRRSEERAMLEAPTPEVVARTILRAATDESNRLRYPVAANPFLLLHSILPFTIWRGLVETSIRGR
jgi:NAD(P)-dependent dehydrogenase (short-subunit alcohol dehydrogenase family)